MTTKTISKTSSLDAQIKSICDIMRRSNAASALQYIPELTWILFLRVFDEREESVALNASIVGNDFTPALQYPYRWRDWAAPDGDKRQELQNGYSGGVFQFVNHDLIPNLKEWGGGGGVVHMQPNINGSSARSCLALKRRG